MSDDIVPGGTEIDESNCEREPIHIPGTVQPHGVLLTAEGPDSPVLQVSANCADVFGRPPQEVLGTSLVELFHPSTARMLRRAVADSEAERMIFPWRVAVGEASDDPAYYDLLAHHNGSVWVLELEAATDPQDADDLLSGDESGLSRLSAAQSVAELLEDAVGLLRALTGFDRVMVYRFDADWNGRVVAEDRREDLEPFLGLHYPASDIPPQARALYAVNWLRFIRDVGVVHAPLVPVDNPQDQQPLDLSRAALRSVSPIHVQYLVNMGVTASMSVSLVIGGELAGLIACHHYSGPFVPPATTRAVCEFVAQTLSWLLDGRELEERNERSSMIWQGLMNFRRSADHAGTTAETLFATHADSLMKIMGANGIAWRVGGDTATAGEAPPPSELDHIRRWADGGSPTRPVVHTDELPAAVPELAEGNGTPGGVLFLKLAEGQDVMFFRSEEVHTVDWAGDPRHKGTQRVDEGGELRLSPRGSFELWRETVRGRSRAWDHAELTAARQLGSHLVQVF